MHTWGHLWCDPSCSSAFTKMKFGNFPEIIPLWPLLGQLVYLKLQLFFRFSAILETLQTFDYFPVFTKPLRKWNNFWKILFFATVYGQKATRLTRNNWTESIRHAAASIISSIQLWSKHKQLIVVALLYISCFLPTISRNRV